jgi:hypothetical protein
MSIWTGLAALLVAEGADQAPRCEIAAMAAQLGAGLRPAELRAAIQAAQAHPLGTRENPVRVCDPTGERGYLARLRCPDGNAPRIGQRANIGPGPYRTILDRYPLDCGDAAPGRTELVMDMYHDEPETAAPPGFTIVPD